MVDSVWHPNSEIRPLDMDELKDIVSRDDQGKKSKTLWSAFQVAAEEHDLDYFKSMLLEHERRVIQERQEQEDKEAKKEQQSAKKASRKSIPATEDVEMEDVASDAAPKKKKAAAKRKASAVEDDGEGEALKVRLLRRMLSSQHADSSSPPLSRRLRSRLPQLLQPKRLPRRRNPRLKRPRRRLTVLCKRPLPRKRNLYFQPLRSWRRSRRRVSCRSWSLTSRTDNIMQSSTFATSCRRDFSPGIKRQKRKRCQQCPST
jgi:hypothetical protein